MAWDESKMFWGRLGNQRCNHGKYSFSSTDLTVEVPVRLNKIYAAHLIPLSSTSGVTETLHTDMTVTSGAITVTRQIAPITVGPVNSEDSAHVSANNWVDVPLGICPVAGSISKLKVYNVESCSTGANGYIKLGNIISDGTKDDVDHITGAGSTKQVFPADANYVVVSGDDYFDGTAGRNVSAGDMLIVGSVDGQDIPSGLMAEAEIAPTPTSDLEFAFLFIGL